MRDESATTKRPVEPFFADERARLVRLCRRLTGDADAAEDLAQETLLEAWRLRERLYDPRGRDRWLAAIARNLCRRRGRATARTKAIGDAAIGSDGDGASPLDRAAAGFDLEAELEHHELARLLDRAMADLPSRSREMLVARYVEDAPQTEIAARFGVSEGAVAKRLERGRLVLRRVLSTTLREEAVSYGLSADDGRGWGRRASGARTAGGASSPGSPIW